MRRLAGLIATIALCAAGAAQATVFTVDVLAPPTLLTHDGDTAGYGGASFPDVYLHLGDSLVVTVHYGENVQLSDGAGFIALNLQRYDGQEANQVELVYPFYPDAVNADGFSFTATAKQIYGHPSPEDVFDINAVHYAWQPVPEPAAWALMLVGASLVGARLRQRGAAGARRRNRT